MAASLGRRRMRPASSRFDGAGAGAGTPRHREQGTQEQNNAQTEHPVRSLRGKWVHGRNTGGILEVSEYFRRRHSHVGDSSRALTGGRAHGVVADEHLIRGEVCIIASPTRAASTAVNRASPTRTAFLRRLPCTSPG